MDSNEKTISLLLLGCCIVGFWLWPEDVSDTKKVENAQIECLKEADSDQIMELCRLKMKADLAIIDGANELQRNCIFRGKNETDIYVCLKKYHYSKIDNMEVNFKVSNYIEPEACDPMFSWLPFSTLGDCYSKREELEQKWEKHLTEQDQKIKEVRNEVDNINRNAQGRN